MYILTDFLCKYDLKVIRVGAFMVSASILIIIGLLLVSIGSNLKLEGERQVEMQVDGYLSLELEEEIINTRYRSLLSDYNGLINLMITYFSRISY